MQELKQSSKQTNWEVKQLILTSKQVGQPTHFLLECTHTGWQANIQPNKNKSMERKTRDRAKPIRSNQGMQVRNQVQQESKASKADKTSR